MQGEMDDGGELEGWVEVQWRKRRRGDMEVKEIGRKKKTRSGEKASEGQIKEHEPTKRNKVKQRCKREG